MMANPNIDVQLSGTSFCYISPRTDWFLNLQENEIKNDIAIIGNFDEIPEPILKIAGHIYDFDENAPAIRREMIEKYSAYGDFVYAGNGFLDLLPNNTGKGFALKELMEKKGLSPDEIIVFGDNENDMSMLALSPNSYAKSNSAPNVKAVAAHECDSVTRVLKDMFF
jgi:hydroxymethylpyrimidine pyrophosphatase-like HAD family hydrolase